jgi:hypothetical protein
LKGRQLFAALIAIKIPAALAGKNGDSAISLKVMTAICLKL